MSSPTSYKAAVLLSPKSRHTIETRSLPELKPDEVGIKIEATAINPVDWKMRDYDLFLPGYVRPLSLSHSIDRFLSTPP
tara:strand:- start:497 stop:733 length:237 start_codon:yes stop_codon:yes gene_type:complete